MRAEAQKLHVSVASLTASTFSSLSHAHSYRHDIYRNTRYIYVPVLKHDENQTQEQVIQAGGLVFVV